MPQANTHYPNVIVLLLFFFQNDLSPLVKDLEPGNPEEEACIP